MKTLTTIVLLFLSVTLIGCGQKLPNGMPKLYPCSIQVTQEGKPLADAEVVLESADSKWSPAGKTDAEGVAVLWTYGKYKGAPAGTFKVLIRKYETVGEEAYLSAVQSAQKIGDLQAQSAALAAAKTLPVHRYSLVDMKFDSKDTTPLTVEVQKQKQTLTADAGNAVKVEVVYMK